MGRAETEIGIDRPADDVWAVVRDFGGLADWLPGVESCTVAGDVRTLAMMGMEIKERLVRSDDERRTLVYSITEAPMPVASHEATITVSADGDGSRATWAVEVEPDELTDVMRGVYEQGLGALKQHCER